MITQIEDSVIAKWVKTEPYSINEPVDRVKMSGYDYKQLFVEEVYDTQQKIHKRTYYSKTNDIEILYQSDYFYYNDENKLTHVVTITDDGKFVIKDIEGDELLDIHLLCKEMIERRNSK